VNIHEYQAKSLLAGYGVVIARGKAVLLASEAAAAVAELGGPVWVVKAQIHAGGRGKAGGVKVCKSAEEAVATAEGMFGKLLVTRQTGPAGKEVRRVFIEEGCDIANELYIGAVIDRTTGRVAFMASSEGGVEIEQVAEESPDKIITVSIDPASGCQAFHARKLAFGLGLKGKSFKAALKLFPALYDAMLGSDASMLEINPLVVTGEGDLLTLDAKMNFDDNALYRHPDIEALRDENEEDPAERRASEHELNYIKLDGSIGCMVNGAGLAMATMDIIKLNGGAPANFLDVGGGATRERVTEAFKILLSDSDVKGVLVNIFGGIMRCNVIAEGIVAAAGEIGISVPLVVRLEGTNVEQGKEILAESGYAIISADDLGDAAVKIVAAVAEAG